MNIDIDMSKLLLPHQLKLYKSEKEIAGIYGGRGCGKSYVLSWLCARNLLLGKKSIIFSTNFKQLSLVLIPAIEARIEQITKLVSEQIGRNVNLSVQHNRTSNLFTCGNGAIYPFSYENVDAVRGLTNCEYLILDEIALSPKDILAIAAPCLRASGNKPKIRFASTPKAGSCWNDWIKKGIADNSIDVYTATMYDVPDDIISPEEKAIQLKAITDEELRKQEIYGEILDNVIENCIINLNDLVLQAQGVDRNYYCGIDFARMGNDSTSIVVRNSFEIMEIVNLNKADTHVIASEYKKLDLKYHFKKTCLDATGGYHVGFYDLLKDQYNLTEVNFAGKSLDENCNNARTNMYNELANAIKDGFYINTNRYRDLFEALKVTSYIINGQGKKALVPKEEIKAIIGHSPDALDALALSFYGANDTTNVALDPLYVHDLANTIFGV